MLINNCIICHQSKFKKHSSSGKKYVLKECCSCGLVFDASPPEKISNIYSKNYFMSQKIKGGYFNYFYESVINKLTFKYRLDKLSKLKQPSKSKLLDIGCALGDFLEVAKILQWKKALGVDVSQFAIDICKEKGLDVYKLNTPANLLKKLGADSFDVITMQDVLEHLTQPSVYLSYIHTLLKSGGILFLTTPDIDSISRKLMRKHWYHYKQKEHIYYFNKKSIKKLLLSAGFIDVNIKPSLSWVTLQYIINRMKYYSKNIFSNPLINFLSNLPLCKIAFPIYTGEIEITAIKPYNELSNAKS